MITGIVFSNFVAAARSPGPVGNPSGYINTMHKQKPVIPVYNEKVNVNG